MPRGRPPMLNPNYKHPLYQTWINMRKRCQNPNDANYPAYGGRGITVCRRWDDFSKFLQDMGPKPSPAHTLERVENSESYNPFNCVWALPTRQANNTRSNKYITHQGQTKTIAEWATHFGIRYDLFWRRLRDGKTIEEAANRCPITGHPRRKDP